MDKYKEAEASRHEHLYFLESMDRINRAMQKTHDLNEMMSNTLDEVLAIFDCDRALLIYPCDPEAASWQVSMERTTPEYPGMLSIGQSIPMTPEVAAMHRVSLETEGPLAFGHGTEQPIPEEIQAHGEQSGVGMALFPRLGKPWGFAIIQCSRVRQWNQQELHLFDEIGRRLADGLSSQLFMRELQQSEAKYRRFVESSNEGIWALDAGHQTTFVNARMAEMLGRSEDEIIGHSLAEFMFEEDVVDHEQHMAQRRQGVSEYYERRFRRKDGSELWTLISAKVIEDRDGVFLGSFGMLTDITERKQAEEHLALLSFALNNVREAAFLIDEHARFRFVNEEACRILGYSREALLSMGVADIDPDWPAERWPEHWRQLAQEESLTFEGRHRTSDGRLFPVEISANFIDYAGQQYNLALVRDITERKRVENELLASEQLFRALVENSPDYIARYDREYRRIYVNPAIQHLFHQPIKNVLGQTPAEQSPVKVPQVYIDNLKKVFEGGQESMLETLFRTAQGEMHWGHIRFVPELDASGNVASVLTIGRDIHEIKESEQRLSRFIGNLPAFFFTFGRSEDGRYRFPYASLGIRAIYGLEPEDVREDMTPLHMLAHPDDRAHIEDSIAKAFETRDPFRVEFRVCRPDMPERWVEARSIPHEEADGSLLWYGIMLDITARKRAEQNLAVSEEKFSRAFYASPNLMAITRPEDGRIVDINESFCRFFGYTREECLGHNTAELNMWVDSAQRAIAVQKLQEAGAALYMPVELRTKSGEIRSVIDSMTFIRLGDEKYLLSVATDITERKRNEAVNAARLHLVQFSLNHSLDELLEETLNEVEKLTGSLIGFYHFVEADQISLTLQNWSKRTKAEFCKAEGKHMHYPIDEAGVWVDCVRDGKPVIHNDYAALPHRKGLPEGHAEVVRELVVPVFRGKKITAILGVGNKPTDYTDEDIGIVSLIADLAWEIAERKQAEELLRKSLVETIEVIALTVEKRDLYTAGHQKRVAVLSEAIGTKLGLDEERLEGLRLGAMIHDIGKVSVPAEILSHPGRLHELELAIVKSHAQTGYDIVKDVQFPWPVAEMILQHHERMDGTGYPRGLKGDDIILEARIIMVADVVEAMSSHRPYRVALGFEAAIHEIEAGRGTKFDPAVVDACLALYREGKLSTESGAKSPGG